MCNSQWDPIYKANEASDSAHPEAENSFHGPPSTGSEEGSNTCLWNNTAYK